LVDAAIVLPLDANDAIELGGIQNDRGWSSRPHRCGQSAYLGRVSQRQKLFGKGLGGFHTARCRSAKRPPGEARRCPQETQGIRLIFTSYCGSMD
jgi:hypothetical protein